MTDDVPFLDDALSDLASVALPLPGVAHMAGRLLAGVRAEWRRNTSKALRAASEASGLSREDFVEWLADEPRAVPLYLKVLWAAGINGHDQTLRGMGAVLGRAAHATRRDDSEGFADAELALRAMAELTERHFRVLAVIARSSVRGEAGSENYSEFVPPYVATQTGLASEIAHQCLLNLAAAGLAEQKAVLGNTAYPITELGHAVVAAAQVAHE